MADVQGRKREKKMQMGRKAGGRNGIGGFLVLGAAAAALVAALASQRKKTRPTNKTIKNRQGNPSEDRGLLFLLQTPSPSAENHHCHEEALRIHAKRIGSCQSVAIRSLTSEKELTQDQNRPKWGNGERNSNNSSSIDYDFDFTNTVNSMDQEEQSNDESVLRDSVDKREENPSLQLHENNNNKEEEEDDKIGSGESMKMGKVQPHLYPRMFLLLSTILGFLIILVSHLIAKCYYSSKILPSNGN